MARNNIFDEVDSIHWEMERLFHSLFNPRYPFHLLADRKWRPLTDMYETDGEIVIKVEIPGVERENISLSLEGRRLVIYGKRNNPIKQKGCIVYHQMEINYGEFERTLMLSEDIAENSIKAELKDGFLYITIRMDRAENKKG